MRQNSLRAEFRSRAVVDWIRLTVFLKKGTQFRYVKEHLESILRTSGDQYAKALNCGPGGVSTGFEFKLHDPHTASLSMILGILSAFSSRFPFASPPVVSGIEVSLDFYAKDSVSDIRNLVHRMQLGLDARGNPRQYDPEKSGNPSKCVRFLNPDYPEPITGLVIDPRFNLRIGNQNDAVQWQIYEKKTDNGGIKLPVQLQRARAEFTLSGDELTRRVQGEECGANRLTLDELRSLKFETLARLLHFRRFKSLDEITSNPTLAKMLSGFHRWRQHGVTNYRLGMLTTYRDSRRSDLIRRLSLRAHSSHTVADDELNDIVRRALKSLTKRFA